MCLFKTPVVAAFVLAKCVDHPNENAELSFAVGVWMCVWLKLFYTFGPHGDNESVNLVLRFGYTVLGGFPEVTRFEEARWWENKS